MELLAGSLLERPPGPKYTAELRFAELAPKSPLPKPSTLTKWRKRLPEDFEMALRAPEACWNPPEGPLREGDSLEQGLAWLLEAASALKASLIIVATGAAVATGARDRERLRTYFGRLVQSEGIPVVWRPTGLWEPEAAQRMARSLGVIGGFDAVDDPTPQQSVVYATVFAEGLRRSFSHAQLLEVLEKLGRSGATRAYVTVDSPQSFQEARLLQALAEGRA